MSALTSIPGWQVYVWTVAILVPAGIHLAVTRNRDTSHMAEAVLMYALGVSGAIGMFNAVVHTAFADAVAMSIGWPVGSPFQTEVAFANLALGIIGFLCFWRYDFWLPVVIGKSVFLFGAGVTHVLDMLRTGNVASNNAGPILVWDFVLPLALMSLYVLARSARDRVSVTPGRHASTRWRLEARS
jgi:hypothetical protein